MVADTYIRDRAELRRQLALATDARTKARDEMVRQFLAILSLDERILVLLDRWNAVEGK